MHGTSNLFTKNIHRVSDLFTKTIFPFNVIFIVKTYYLTLLGFNLLSVDISQ